MAITFQNGSVTIGGVAGRTNRYEINNTGLAVGVAHTPADFASIVAGTGSPFVVDTENRVLTITNADVWINGRWDDTGWVITLDSERFVSANNGSEWTSGENQNGQFVRGATWRIPNPPSNACLLYTSPSPRD